MKRIITNYTYFRLFLFLSVVYVVIFMLFTLFITNQISSYSFREMNSFLQDKLSHTAENTDFVFFNLKNYGLRMYEDRDIGGWLFTDKKDPLLEAYASNTAARYIANQPFIYKAYLINETLQSIIDTRRRLFTFEDFDDQRMLEKVRENASQYLNIFSYDQGDQSFLAMIIPASYAAKKYGGYVVLLLDKELIEKYLLQQSENTGIHILVLDAKGQWVMGDKEPELVSLAAQSRTAGDGIKVEQDLRHSSLFVLTQRIEMQDWSIAYLCQYRYLQSKARTFEGMIILSLLLLLVVLVALIFFSSRYTYKPINNLVERIKTKHTLLEGAASVPKALNRSPREYEVIENAIDILTNNIDHLNSSIRDSKGFLKEENLREWFLYGRMSGLVREFIQKNTRLFEFANLNLAVIRIESYPLFTQKYNFSSQKLMKFSIANIAEECIANSGWTSESVDMGSDHVCLLVGRNNRETDGLLSVLENIKQQIGTWLDIPVVIGAGEARGIDEDLRSAFDSIYELTKLKFVSGVDKVYEQKDALQYTMRAGGSPNDDEKTKNLITAVRLGEQEGIRSLLEELASSMKTLAYSECKFQMTAFLYSFEKAFPTRTPLKDLDAVSRFIDSFNTLEEVMKWFEEEVSHISEELAAKNAATRKRDVVLQIVEYVKNQLHDPMLTIEDVAEHISLSTGYVRHIFKETMNTTLSDYIVKERINYVKRLLETTDWPVADIAERVGFQTRSSFFSTFKKETGVTPNQYRLNFKNRQ